eukprot:GDKH01022956.1.p1 GENE.GDKH01022956.1~~GDKH01022956.1.p1  ORF type:complete len:300 (-),score=57.76 GDKH01022956.1:19-918(-)
MASLVRNLVSGVTRRSVIPFSSPSQSLAAPALLSVTRRNYAHWQIMKPHDFGLGGDSMPKDMREIMKQDPEKLDFYENYWYWQVRGDATMLNPEELPKKSYKQLTRDLGLAQIDEPSEQMVGLLELYEYLKEAPFIGPFGTVENPVIVPSAADERLVACTGGSGDNEHVTLWFRCREGFLYRCGECDQIFMLVRVDFEMPEGQELFPKDRDVEDTFDWKLVEKAQQKYNEEDFVLWPIGDMAVRGQETYTLLLEKVLRKELHWYQMHRFLMDNKGKKLSLAEAKKLQMIAPSAKDLEGH